MKDGEPRAFFMMVFDGMMTIIALQMMIVASMCDCFAGKLFCGAVSVVFWAGFVCNAFKWMDRRD